MRHRVQMFWKDGPWPHSDSVDSTFLHTAKGSQSCSCAIPRTANVVTNGWDQCLNCCGQVYIECSQCHGEGVVMSETDDGTEVLESCKHIPVIGK